MTLNEALVVAIQALKNAGVPDAANDARILLANALEIERSRLTLILPDEMSEVALARYTDRIDARCQRKPVSQIIGTRAFYGREFVVTPEVLDPRPETELLVETALAQPFDTVLDIGVGSGCILLTLLAETESTTGCGADISDAALDVARQNAKRFALGARSQLITSDWFTDIRDRFDLIVSNPPYVTADEMLDLSPEVRNWEPEIALTPGGDGLDAYRIIAASAKQYLTSRGCLIVEIGHTQSASVQALFQAAGFKGITTLKDLDGRDRVVVGNVS